MRGRGRRPHGGHDLTDDDGLWHSPTPEAAGRPLPDGPTTGTDRPILEAYLAAERATFLNICAGLRAEQLAARPVPSSALSLLGLARHFAKVERIWLRQRAAGQDVPPLHGGAGDPTDFAADDPAQAEHEIEALLAEWDRADEAAMDLPFDHEVDVHGEPFSLRMIYVHLVAEYARHNGHADLLREAIDGATGR